MLLLLNTETRQTMVINEIDVYAAIAGTITIQVFYLMQKILYYFSHLKNT